MICKVLECESLVWAKGLCNKHYLRKWKTGSTELIRPSLEERFWNKVMPEPNSGCWLWDASTTPDGYGKFVVNGNLQPAHRFSYELNVGKIPEGLHLDHLCRVPQCVNPDHLEPVTRSENVRRGKCVALHVFKTHCPHGHEYAGDNLYVNPDGRRICRTCKRESEHRRRERNRAIQP